MRREKDQPQKFNGPEPFTGFGESRFIPPGLVPKCHRILGEKPAQLKKGVHADSPAIPGVYAMLDPMGRIIYVGKAKSLRSRLMSYFRTRSRDPKAARIIKRTRGIVWESATDEFAALLRELELIQRIRPRFNVQGQPGRRRYTYLVISNKPPRSVFLTSTPAKEDKPIYGPFIHREKLDQAIRRLNDRYKLRDCADTIPMRFADSQAADTSSQLTGGQTSKALLVLTPQCLRYDLAKCAGPCAAKCTQDDYEKNVLEVKAFLDGNNRRILDETKAEMITASEAMNYERAAASRDKLVELQWLDERLAQLQKARGQLAFFYPLVSHDGQTVWYLIDRGQVRGVMLGKARKVPKELKLCVSKLPNFSKKEVDSVLLVAAWFRKNKDERKALKPAS